MTRPTREPDDTLAHPLEVPLSHLTWIVITASLAAMGLFVWVFRRFVTLFAALDASERLEENRPTPGAEDLP